MRTLSTVSVTVIMSEKILTYLNEQLLSEYDAMFSYLYHAAKSEDPETRDLLDSFWQEEAGHIRMLMAMILQKGGIPILAKPQLDLAANLLTTLVFSLAAEESAVKKYEMILQLLQHPEDRILFEQAIREEQRHQERLQEILTRLRAREKERNKPTE